MIKDLTQLPNIGKVLTNELAKIGITTYDELAALGSVQATLRIRYGDDTACTNTLYALEGARE